MSSRDPSRLGQFKLGYSRLGVYDTRRGTETSLLRLARTVTWRVAVFQHRDTYTGHREATYPITHSIKGVFEEQGGELMPLPSGFVQNGDAVVRVMDGVKALDQILLPESNRYYQVQYVQPFYEYSAEGDMTTFLFRICDLNYLGLYIEG